MSLPTDASTALSMADFAGLAQLRRDAQAQSPSAIREAAKQFEALFINSLLSQMRQTNAVFDSGLFDRDNMRIHEQMYDSQLAQVLAGKGIGLADAIARQLGDTSLPAGIGGSPRPLSVTPPPALAALRLQGATTQAAQSPAAKAFQPDSPAEFVAALWPHAQVAAAELDIDPQVLVAQAALESGWGQAMIRHPDGRPSFNLFGIKAGADWQGERVQVSTLEFVDGAFERQREPFRAYPDLASAFADYVQLIGQRARYEHLPGTQDAAAYAQGLQAAGYATDPDYASKIIGILQRGLPGLTRTQDSPLLADTQISNVRNPMGSGPGVDL